jgi:triosephosphate isomerase (TIM)
LNINMTDTKQITAPLIARSQCLVMGNWKMNGSMSFNNQLLNDIVMGAASLATSAQLVVCVPSPYLAQACERLSGTPVQWGAQDVSVHTKGAFTGEIGAGMLTDFGCRWVLVGHSERRTLHAESDAVVAQKALAALNAGLTPVVCVGESLQERDAGLAEAVIKRQLAPVLALGAEAVMRLVVAYEPVWAIGTGRTASAQQAQDIHAVIRRLLPSSDHTLVLYGGSVKPDNAKTLFAMPDIDGGLIGGASLVATDFLAIAS